MARARGELRPRPRPAAERLHPRRLAVAPADRRDFGLCQRRQSGGRVAARLGRVRERRGRRQLAAARGLWHADRRLRQAAAGQARHAGVADRPSRRRHPPDHAGRDHRGGSRDRRGADADHRRRRPALRPAARGQAPGRRRAAARARRQDLPRHQGRRLSAERAPDRQPAQREHRELSGRLARPAGGRGVLRRRLRRGDGAPGRPRRRRFRDRRTGRAARQRLAAAAPAARADAVARREVHPRQLFARQGRPGAASAACWPRRTTTACSSPARLATRATSRPRTAPTKPASPPPKRRLPRSAVRA